jgi:protein gp37
MQKTKIDWGIPNLYTWNPVVGCKRGCHYCFAKRLNDRFKWVSDFTKITEIPHRLLNPTIKKNPCTIFVGSMSDVCYWPHGYIRTVLNVCRDCPQHTFMFLTKRPITYWLFDWPENCVLGLTITGERILYDQYMIISDLMSYDTTTPPRSLGRVFLSIEPLLGEIVSEIPESIEKVIVGAMTGPGAIVPKKEWIESIKHSNIFWKPSIRKYL